MRAYITGLRDRLSSRCEERRRNDRDSLSPPDPSSWSKMDSSVKRNSAFVKRLRTNLSESSRDSILKELSVLNVSKFITEVTSALIESKIKMTDVPLMLSIAGHLNQRYPDFGPSFLDAWTKVLPRKGTDLQSINVSKLRVDVRLFADLISCNIFSLKEGLPLLGQVIKVLTGSGSASAADSNGPDVSVHLPVILSFCKSCAEEFLGVIPLSISSIIAERKMTDVSIPQSTLLTPERQKVLLNMMQDYLTTLVSRIQREKRLLRHMDMQNRKQLMSRGEVSAERKEQFDQTSIALSKLVSSAQQFADLIGQPFPDLPSDPIDVMSEFADMTVTEGMSIEISNRFKNGSASDLDPLALFEDDDSRSFYQSLPDLKSQIPSILYKDSAGTTTSTSQTPSPVGTEDKNMDTTTTTGGEEDKHPDKQELEEEKDLLNDLTGGKVTDLLFVETEDAMELSLDVEDKSLEDTASNSPSVPTPSQAAVKSTASNNKVLMDSFLTSLSSCVSREHVDKAALTFCTNLNTKVNRNKLIRALFSVPRNRLDLLPFYARLAKTLQSVMPHVASDLVSALKQDFKFHVRKKDQINIESKVKTMRYIGELVKFELFSKPDVLNCLKILLLDFKHHQITMACTLIESCGRFLFRSPDSHSKMNLLLELMMRKKALLPYDSTYVTLIENAYYAANTSDSGTGITRIQRPVMHEYIRKLLYSDLNKGSVEKVCRQMRKLDWDDGSIAYYVMKSMTAVHNMTFLNIGCMANLLSLLSEYHEDAVFRVLDAVLEDIKLLLEVNHVQFNQRRISMVHFLGQMYIYRLVPADLIFTQLYSFLSFGVVYPAEGESPDTVSSPLDPPDNLFRIRLVCALLDSCSAYFTSESTRKKLDCFILYFQRYYWHKRSHSHFSCGQSDLTSVTDPHSFPIVIQNLFFDTIRGLRPRFAFAKDAQQANSLLNDLITELRDKAVQLYPHLKESSAEGQQAVLPDAKSLDTDLRCIPEEGEEDEENNDTGSNDEEDEEDEDMSDEEESDSESDTDSDQEDNNSSDEQKDEATSSRKKTPIGKVVSPEDQEFEKEFERLMTESLMSRTSESAKPMTEMSLPIDYQERTVIATGLRKNFKKLPPTALLGPSAVAQKDQSDQQTMKLTVMTRHKGNKPLFRAVNVPLDSELALELRQKEERIRREKEELKHLTLVMNDRIDEAEATGNQVPGSGGSYMKTRKPHNRGVPDADLIFGSHEAASGSSDEPQQRSFP